MRITGYWNVTRVYSTFSPLFLRSLFISSPNVHHHPTNGTLLTGFPTEGVCKFFVPDVDVGFCIWIIFAVWRYRNCSCFYAVDYVFNIYVDITYIMRNGVDVHLWTRKIVMCLVADPMPSFDIALELPSKMPVWNSFYVRENGWTMSSETHPALYKPSNILHFPDSVINGGGHCSPFSIK